MILEIFSKMTCLSTSMLSSPTNSGVHKVEIIQLFLMQREREREPDKDIDLERNRKILNCQCLTVLTSEHWVCLLLNNKKSCHSATY